MSIYLVVGIKEDRAKICFEVGAQKVRATVMILEKTQNRCSQSRNVTVGDAVCPGPRSHRLRAFAQ